jgi:transposase
MSIINAIRNKLILRIFACVRDDRFYEKKHQYLFG